MTEWIKCSDRMPEPGEYVVIAGPGELLCDGPTCVVACYVPPSGAWPGYWSPCPHDGDYSLESMTHWMPLPSPPEVE